MKKGCDPKFTNGDVNVLISIPARRRIWKNQVLDDAK